MADPNPLLDFDIQDFFCIPPFTLPPPKRVRLPGPVELIDLDLIGLIGPALTPLTPIFKLIELILVIVETIEAVGSLNPITIAEALEALGAALAEIFALFPPGSIVFTALDLIDLLIHVTRQSRIRLERLLNQLNRIDAATDRAFPGDQNLLDILTCSSDNVQVELNNEAAFLSAIGSTVALTNIILGLLGAPKIPDFSELSGLGVQDAIDALEDIEEVLLEIRDAVPIP